MLLRLIYSFIPLGIGAVWAQQTPLNSANGACLSSTGGNRETSRLSCCPTDDFAGKGSVGGNVFTYNCGQWASKYDRTPHPAATPRDCAQICASEASCVAATWDSRKGHCYVTYEHMSYVPLQTARWILIAKTQETAIDDPSVPDPGAIAQCNNEKDAIRRELAAQCEAETNALKATQQDALRQADDRCRAEKAALEQDKARCEQDKASLEQDKSRCEQEKARQNADAAQQCDAKTSELEKNLQECKTQQQNQASGGGGGSFAPAGTALMGCYQDHGGEQRVLPSKELNVNDMTLAKCAQNCQGFKYFGVEWSSQCFCGNTLPPKKLPLSECNKACSGSKDEFCGGDWRLNVYQYGVAPSAPVDKGPQGFSSNDPGCSNLDWFRCDRGCREFSVNGVEYTSHCSVGVLSTQQEVSARDRYSSIADCLEKRCNPDPTCMGVGWVEREKRTRLKSERIDRTTDCARYFPKGKKPYIMADPFSLTLSQKLAKASSGDKPVNYAETDNGFDTSDSDKVIIVTPAPSGSDSPDLIDLSDFDDVPTPKTSIDWNSRDQLLSEEKTDNLPEKKDEGLDKYPQAKASLDPESPPFTPRNGSSSGNHTPPSSSRSSYTDAQQTLDSRDDTIRQLRARVIDLEDGHETLKRANDSLDTNNEDLKHKREEDERQFERLRDDLAESELLRTRAQKTAIEQSEKCDELYVELSRVQQAYENVEPEIAEYKRKLSGALASNKPLHDQVQYLQSQLLNAAERIKEIKYFARVHLAKNPQDIEAFASVGLTLGGEAHALDSSQIEAEALISFDGPADSTNMDDDIYARSRSDSVATERAPPRQQDDTMSVTTFYDAESTPAFTHQQEEDAMSANSLYDAPSTPPTPVPEHVELQRTPEVTQSSFNDNSGIKWSQDSDQLWISEFEKAQAIRSHQGARHVTQTPGMFIHGIRFVRQHTRQKLTTDDDIPDVLSRRVIISGLPDGVHIQRALEHVRGGRILRAHIIATGKGDNSNNIACIEFSAAEDAMDFYRFSRRREFGFFFNDASVRARLLLPASDSFPLSDPVQAKLSEGCTRCLFVTDFPVVHLQGVLSFAGMSRNYADIVTHFACSDDGSFEVHFSSIQSAVTVRDYIIRSKFYQGHPDGTGVSFIPDPCSAPVESLIVPFLPTQPTSDLAILDPKNAHRFMTEEERQLDSDRLMEEVLAASDPSDPDAFHEQDLRKTIVWEKEAKWDGLPIYMAYDPDQRRTVPHQRDPASGAVRTQYHGQWVLSPEESRKMWLHYNQDSEEPWTQKTADLFYASTGDIDIRKIVVDDGGLDGDADQFMNPCEPAKVLEVGSSSSAYRTPAPTPTLTEMARGYFTVNDHSKHIPLGVYVNNIGCNSGLEIPSLLDHNFDHNTTNIVSTANVPPHKRVRNLDSSSGFSSPARSVVDDDIGGAVHGISKAGFNQLTARIAKDKSQMSSKAAGKASTGQPPFW
ncbi:hypothetical protein CkaCkLH20_08561 [Colletotrichum karsti]|uniref:WSC domain-containing protein n=1 Tax=Colletotrichum karsti TaxID=1095194 RepID=A0A9P6LIP3_9PEZI|nr:uncharacterized protein CkaCkLH20_08561 [Colletotrichum karsti]KAF9873827.1 hypothetical protein CkaCkLH20_08561 [Colletotrichum karsti]